MIDRPADELLLETEWQVMLATVRIARDEAWRRRRFIKWLDLALWAWCMRRSQP